MKVLVIIDMQNDFITGSLGSQQAIVAKNNLVHKLEDGWAKEFDGVFFTKDTHDSNSYMKTHEGKYLPVEHCIYGTPGHEIPKEITNTFSSLFDYSVILKNTFGYLNWKESFDSFQENVLGRFQDRFPSQFEDINEIHICGLCTDICVISNALILRAMYPEADIICHSNLCAGTDERHHLWALEVMKSNHIDIVEDKKYD